MQPVRFSHLKHIGRSPSHYREARRGRPDSASLRLGRLVDILTFGGDPLVFDGSRRGKAWDAFEEANPGADLFTSTELATAEPIVASLLEDPRHWHARDLLTHGTFKERIHWSWLGRPCSGEPDVAGEFLVDLKTTRNAQPEWFKRDALWRSYHAQLAWYRNGLLLCGSQPPAECYIVAVETSPPYPVTVLRLTERTIEQGERLCRLWMERLISCESSNQWPGYVQSAVDWEIEAELDLTFGDDEEAA